MPIPKRVYQTWPLVPDSESLLGQALSKNAGISPGYSFRIYDDAAMEAWFRVAALPHGVKAAFYALNPAFGAARTDLWRYAVLWQLGGIYYDMDVQLRSSLDRIIRPTDRAVLVHDWPLSEAYRDPKFGHYDRTVQQSGLTPHSHVHVLKCDCKLLSLRFRPTLLCVLVQSGFSPSSLATHTSPTRFDTLPTRSSSTTAAACRRAPTRVSQQAHAEPPTIPPTYTALLLNLRVAAGFECSYLCRALACLLSRRSAVPKAVRHVRDAASHTQKGTHTHARTHTHTQNGTHTHTRTHTHTQNGTHTQTVPVTRRFSPIATSPRALLRLCRWVTGPDAFSAAIKEAKLAYGGPLHRSVSTEVAPRQADIFRFSAHENLANAHDNLAITCQLSTCTRLPSFAPQVSKSDSAKVIAEFRLGRATPQNTSSPPRGDRRTWSMRQRDWHNM